MKGGFLACLFGHAHLRLHQKFPVVRKSPSSFLGTQGPSCSTLSPPPLSFHLCPLSGPWLPEHSLLCLPGQLALNETALMPLSASPQVQLECQHLRVPSRNLPSFSQTVLIAPTSALTHHFIIALRTALLFRRRRDLFMCLINGPIPSGWCRAWYVARLMTGLMSE